jgi:hypothetical protein
MVDFEERLGRFSSNTYRSLRPAQRHVLETYASGFLDVADVGIELPTGTGKTLIALLIADWALDEGMAVAYLSGNRQLAEQVEVQAQQLGGLPIHRFWGKHYPAGPLYDYHQAQAIGVMNYWVYFNAKPVVQPADLLILDDAHIAEQPLTGLFTLRIERRRWPDIYVSLCDLVLARTESYHSLRSLRDGTAPFYTPPELLAFNDWTSIVQDTEGLIDQSRLPEEDDTRFIWPSLRGLLSRCGVLIGPSAIEIRPYHPPTQTVPGYSEAKRRIYMSATLGSMHDLQRRLGVKTIAYLPIPAEMRKEQTGDRLLLLNPSSDLALSTEPLEFATDQSAQAGKTAWLCSSHAEADAIEDFLRIKGEPVFRLRSGEEVPLEAWRGSHGGHLVTAGRFDGLDFAGDVCRLVILPGVPVGSTEFERFIVAYLGDATFMRHRIGQRVTQALGRANRDPSDWAMYVGLDPSFGSLLADPAVNASLSEEVTEVVREALRRHGGGWAEATAVGGAFWAGRGELPETPVGERRPGRRRAGASEAPSANDEVEAATALWVGDFSGAAAHARKASKVLREAGEREHSAFWRYVESHALWLSRRPGSLKYAEDALEDVLTEGPRTAWFVRLRRTLDEIRGSRVDGAGHDPLFLEWEEWIREAGGTISNEVVRHRTALVGSHDERAAALVTLARLCGATANRPSESSAPDCIWTWVTPRRTEKRVWEVKAPKAWERVPRQPVNQLLGQIATESNRARKAHVVGCLLTPISALEDDAAAAARDRIAFVAIEAATTLYDLMADRLRDYLRRRGTGTAEERGAARDAVEMRLPPPGWLVRVLVPRPNRSLMAMDVQSEFPSA